MNGGSSASNDYKVGDTIQFANHKDVDPAARGKFGVIMRVDSGCFAIDCHEQGVGPRYCNIESAPWALVYISGQSVMPDMRDYLEAVTNG